MKNLYRRQFLRDLGISASALPFLAGLPSLTGAPTPQRKQRLIIMFSPNGTLPNEFWPDQEGADFSFKSILKPLEPFKKQMLVLHGIANKVKGDGDSHMRGMSCLLTCDELLKGNIMGGGGNPAGWASNISIDQELKNFLQSRAETKTRFGSLEFGVAVPERADPWTLKKVSSKLSARDKALLDQHMTLVRSMEQDLADADKQGKLIHPVPQVDPSIELVNDNTPQISRIQIDLLVNSLANDMARIGTLQYMRSVGMAQMRWLGIQEGHHSLSHDPDDKKDSYEKLMKINTWFAGEFAYLAKRLRETPEATGGGSMLDNTLLVWTNELGKGNSHTLDNIPYIMIGGGCGFKMGRSLKFDKAAHNRLWMSVAQGMGHNLQTFGKKELCEGGALALS
ncbi:DUF1552 domain-containing protein [Prosthecobacter sp.]|uniref:DUF1552 domain-containing protein n=1 Tax=Prosthecobacter sp. TaxID=1965333 RepID=UPI0037845395